jgi:hypothetical protein
MRGVSACSGAPSRRPRSGRRRCGRCSRSPHEDDGRRPVSQLFPPPPPSGLGRRDTVQAKSAGSHNGRRNERTEDDREVIRNSDVGGCERFRVLADGSIPVPVDGLYTVALRALVDRQSSGDTHISLTVADAGAASVAVPVSSAEDGTHEIFAMFHVMLRTSGPDAPKVWTQVVGCPSRCCELRDRPADD